MSTRQIQRVILWAHYLYALQQIFIVLSCVFLQFHIDSLQHMLVHSTRNHSLVPILCYVRIHWIAWVTQLNNNYISDIRIHIMPTGLESIDLFNQNYSIRSNYTIFSDVTWIGKCVDWLINSRFVMIRSNLSWGFDRNLYYWHYIYGLNMFETLFLIGSIRRFADMSCLHLQKFHSVHRVCVRPGEAW